MGYEPIDAWYEEADQAAYDAAIEQYKSSDHFAEDADTVIEEFKEECLKSYYIENPRIADPSFNLLKEAKELFALKHYGASQVFSATTTEVAFGNVLLKPLVYGYVHSPDAAEIFIKAIDETKAIYRFERLLIPILEKVAGIDLHTYKMANSSQKLWDGLKCAKEQRNRILHSTIQSTEEAAALSISVASTLLKVIFPAVINGLGLHLHQEVEICGKNSCGAGK